MANNYTTVLSDKNYRPDWSINDESNPAFIKDRPFYTTDPVETVVLEEFSMTLDISEGENPEDYVIDNYNSNLPPVKLVLGEVYDVTYNGSVYRCTPTILYGDFLYIGNHYLQDKTDSTINTGEPFVLYAYRYGSSNAWLASSEKTFTISVIGFKTETHQLDPKYIPDMYYTNYDVFQTNLIRTTTDITISSTSTHYSIGSIQDFVEGYTYTIGLYRDSWEEYKCVAWKDDSSNTIFVGNGRIEDIENGEEVPFIFYKNSSGSLVISSSVIGDISFYIYVDEPVIIPIDKKYLPFLNDNLENGAGTGSIAMYRSSYAKGDYSSAFNDARAYGDYSHAEGSGSITIGSTSHAEGHETLAVGYGSHAEGKGAGATGFTYLQLSGEANSTTYTITGYSTSVTIMPGQILADYSYNIYAIITDYNSNNKTVTLNKTLNATEALDSEIYYLYTGTSGSYAHSEGSLTTAYGDSSHAEGYHTTAFGKYSHAEGYYTMAASNYQHAQGKYNIEDEGNTYAHIVGNGTSNSNRSNAHTLDWNGNAWFAGEVYIGGTGQDDPNAVKLSAGTPTVTTADNGKFLRVIDGAWAAATVPNAEEVSF